MLASANAMAVVNFSSKNYDCFDKFNRLHCCWKTNQVLTLEMSTQWKSTSMYRYKHFHVQIERSIFAIFLLYSWIIVGQLISITFFIYDSISLMSSQSFGYNNLR